MKIQKKIAVLFGGNSTEYEVSLQSAHSVIEHMDQSLYEVCLIGITRTGAWYLYEGSHEKILHDTWWEDDTCTPVSISNNPADHGLLILSESGVRTMWLDAVFPILHGKNGEDGTVQGVCELAGIPMVGCQMVCSAICMDKEIAHRLAEAAGVRVPQSVLLKNRQETGRALEQVERMGYPVFVKPVKSGSSFGITKVLKKEQLETAIEEAFTHDNQVVIEENIQGFEVGCAIIGEKKRMIGKVDEIELTDGFFDYTEKYTLETSKIHMPARISDLQEEVIKQTALQIYDALGCSGFARVDMFLTPEGAVVFNEVNTIPGFTSHSRFPNMLKGAGYSFEEIIGKMIGVIL